MIWQDEGTLRPGYWFKPKSFGYGATPATWQGWAATLVFIAVATAITWLSLPDHPAFILLLAPLLIAFVWLCWIKTDGDWRWRNGG